MITFEL